MVSWKSPHEGVRPGRGAASLFVSCGRPQGAIRNYELGIRNWIGGRRLSPAGGAGGCPQGAIRNSEFGILNLVTADGCGGDEAPPAPQQGGAAPLPHGLLLSSTLSVPRRVGTPSGVFDPFRRRRLLGQGGAKLSPQTKFRIPNSEFRIPNSPIPNS